MIWLAGYMGAIPPAIEAVLGVRAEDLRPVQSPEAGRTIPVRPMLVEPLGPRR